MFRRQALTLHGTSYTYAVPFDRMRMRLLRKTAVALALASWRVSNMVCGNEAIVDG